MLARKLICVDINPEFFAPLKSSFPDANLEFYQPAGYDLQCIGDDSIDLYSALELLFISSRKGFENTYLKCAGYYVREVLR